MKAVRVGVVGTGKMGQRHCRVYASLRGAELVGVSDVNVECGRRVADDHETVFFPVLGDLLTQVDAVSVAVPTPLHCEVTLECLAHDVHVLVEKPIACTLPEASLMEQSAATRGLILQVGHIERFNPAYRELKNVLQDGRIAVINIERLSPFLGSNTDVDVVLDLMTHDIDLVIDLLGQEPVAVEAFGLRGFSGEVDHAIAHLDYAGYPLVTLVASRITEQKVRSIEVTDLSSYVECDLLNKVIGVHRCTVGEYQNHNARSVKYRQESIVERISVPAVEPLYLELEYFTRSVRKGLPAEVPASQGTAALRLALQIREKICERLAREPSTPDPTLFSYPADASEA